MEIDNPEHYKRLWVEYKHKENDVYTEVVDNDSIYNVYVLYGETKADAIHILAERTTLYAMMDICEIVSAQCNLPITTSVQSKHYNDTVDMSYTYPITPELKKLNDLWLEGLRDYKPIVITPHNPDLYHYRFKPSGGGTHFYRPVPEDAKPEDKRDKVYDKVTAIYVILPKDQYPGLPEKMRFVSTGSTGKSLSDLICEYNWLHMSKRGGPYMWDIDSITTMTNVSDKDINQPGYYILEDQIEKLKNGDNPFICMTHPASETNSSSDKNESL
jgi:hypothetical protein